MRGTNGADFLTGNAGDNICARGLGDDVLNGGGGVDDTADYSTASGSVNVTLTDVVDGFGQFFGASSGAAGNDILSGIERIRGSDSADTLTGNSQDNLLRGNLGADFINGGGGFDFADYTNATASVFCDSNRYS